MDDDARHLAALTRRMTELGAPDPAGWAGSEVREGIAQQARYLVLRRLWVDAIDGWAQKGMLGRVPATAQLLAQGATAPAVARAMRLAAYEAVLTTLSVIDEGADPNAPFDAPRWALMEFAAEEELTGRFVGGLHEDLLILDPSGREGSDLFD